MQARTLWISLTFTILTASSNAATVKNLEAAVRDDKATMEKDARWIYIDVQKGLAEAKWRGKPLLVVQCCERSRKELASQREASHLDARSALQRTRGWC